MLWTVLALTVPAQVATTGQLVGAAQDQSGAVVPGVELQLQNEDTKVVTLPRQVQFRVQFTF
jgi:hypothetical protein